MTRFSPKAKTALAFLIIYTLMMCAVVSDKALDIVDGVVSEIAPETVIVQADSKEYMVKRDTPYVISKKIGDSIELALQDGQVYDKSEIENVKRTNKLTRNMYIIGIGIMGILTMLIIMAWPTGGTYTIKVHHEGNKVWFEK